MKTISRYITADGREFVDFKEAERHENSIINDFVFAYDIFGRRLTIDFSNPTFCFLFIDPAIVDTFQRYYKMLDEFQEGGLYYRDVSGYWIHLSNTIVNTIKNINPYD